MHFGLGLSGGGCQQLLFYNLIWFLCLLIADHNTFYMFMDICSLKGDKVLPNDVNQRDSYRSDASETDIDKKGGVTIVTTDVIIGDDGGIDNPFLLDEDDQPEVVGESPDVSI